MSYRRSTGCIPLKQKSNEKGYSTCSEEVSRFLVPFNSTEPAYMLILPASMASLLHSLLLNIRLSIY